MSKQNPKDPEYLADQVVAGRVYMSIVEARANGGLPLMADVSNRLLGRLRDATTLGRIHTREFLSDVAEEAADLPDAFAADGPGRLAIQRQAAALISDGNPGDALALLRPQLSLTGARYLDAETAQESINRVLWYAGKAGAEPDATESFRQLVAKQSWGKGFDLNAAVDLEAANELALD
jgi:hypothetical protein